MSLNSFGLILDFIGVILLLYVSIKTKGSTTVADDNYLISPWFQRVGYIFLAIGFLLQIWANVSVTRFVNILCS